MPQVHLPALTDACRFLLEPARWDPRLYGDWRNDVPVGALNFDVKSTPKAEFKRVSEFLKISVEEVMLRHGFVSAASKWGDALLRTHGWPPEAAISEPEPMGDLFGRLFDEVASEIGMRRTSPKSLGWRLRRKGFVGTLSFRWSVKAMNETKETSTWGLDGTFTVRRPERNAQANDVSRCQNALTTRTWLSPGRMMVGAGDCLLVGDDAVAATVQCAQNAVRCIDYLCDLDRFNAVEDAHNQAIEFLRQLRQSHP